MAADAHPPGPAGVVSIAAVVRGRVQGVGYRDFVQRSARLLGVSGWVCNREDGRSVEVHATGSRSALEALLARLREGPRFARVTDIAVEWHDRSEPGRGFEIRY